MNFWRPFFVFFYNHWRIDPDRSWQVQRLRNSFDKPLRVGKIGLIEGFLSLKEHLSCLAVVQRGGRDEANPAVIMLLVVPVKKLSAVSQGILRNNSGATPRHFLIGFLQFKSMQTPVCWLVHRSILPWFRLDAIPPNFSLIAKLCSHWCRDKWGPATALRNLIKSGSDKKSRAKRRAAGKEYLMGSTNEQR